jgi:hypothetical protein
MDDTLYSRARAKVSNNDTQIIGKLEDRINTWSIKSSNGRHIANNIYIEHFLEEDSMKDLLSFICKDNSTCWNTSECFEDFEMKYEKKCHDHVLKGGKIDDKPQLLGTAIEYETLYKHLVDNYYRGKNGNPKLFNTKRNIIKFISLLSIKPDIHKKNTNIKLKAYSMWSTWNIDNSTLNPFDCFQSNKANEIRASLGLPRGFGLKEDVADIKKQMNYNDNTKSILLLFTYKVLDYSKLKRPTIADAGVNQYFSPPAKSFDKHGFTVPWPDDDPQMKTYIVHPMPECVHESIILSEVSLPITIKL